MFVFRSATRHVLLAVQPVKTPLGSQILRTLPSGRTHETRRRPLPRCSRLQRREDSRLRVEPGVQMPQTDRSPRASHFRHSQHRVRLVEDRLLQRRHDRRRRHHLKRRIFDFDETVSRSRLEGSIHRRSGRSDSFRIWRSIRQTLDSRTFVAGISWKTFGNADRSFRSSGWSSPLSSIGFKCCRSEYAFCKH